MREEENSEWGREKNKERLAGRDRKKEIELDILKGVKKILKRTLKLSAINTISGYSLRI